MRIKRLFLAGLFAATLLTACAKPPYDFIDRKEEGPGGIVVKIRVHVPRDATIEQMQSWCNDLTQSEGKGKAVSVEFLEKGSYRDQHGFCFNGKIYR